MPNDTIRDAVRSAKSVTVAERLMEMNYDDFRAVCEEDIRLADRGEMDEATFDALREPPAIQRFYSMLGQMQKSVEGQLAAGKADMKSRTAKMRLNRVSPDDYQEAVAKYQNWRAGALRFKTGCEQRMTEIAGLLREIDTEFFADRVKEERNDALARVRFLEDAIRKHQEAGCTSDELGDLIT